jgi:hypothetical protein
MKSFIKRYYLLFIYIPILLVSILLCWQDIYKGVFIILLFTSWFISSLKYRTYIPTIFSIFLLLPFNITLQLTELGDPYVVGFFVNYLIPTLSILDIFVGILLIQLFVEKNMQFKELISDRYLLLFFVLLVIQNLFVQHFLTVLLSIRFSVYLFTSILLLRTTKIDTSMLRNVYVKIAFTLSILLQGVMGVCQFLKGVSVGAYFLGESKIVSGMLGSSFMDIQGESYLRAYGTFPHPNILAGWYILVFFLCIYMYLKSESKIYLLNILLILLFIVFTFSRVSIILISISLIVILFKYFLKSKNIYSISPILLYRFLNIFNGDDSSWEDRLKLLQINISILKENILGVGLGNSIKYYSDSIPFTQGGKLLLQPVHNIFILNWVEQGVLIGTYYIYLIYRFFLKGLKLNTVRVLILICITTLGMFDHYLFSLPQGNVILFSSLILLSDLE